MRRRKRYQVVLQLMPGAEPWMRVESGSWGAMKMPAACSLLQLWERLEHPFSATQRPDGEVHVLVPLGDVLTVGGVRERRRRQQGQSD